MAVTKFGAGAIRRPAAACCERSEQLPRAPHRFTFDLAAPPRLLFADSERMATLRGKWMCYYTGLKTSGGNALAGINIQNGARKRTVRLGDLDDRFITDDVAGLVFVANGNRLLGYSVSK